MSENLLFLTEQANCQFFNYGDTYYKKKWKLNLISDPMQVNQGNILAESVDSPDSSALESREYVPSAKN